MLAPEARHGLLGRVVDELAPYTEADPVGPLGHADRRPGYLDRAEAAH